MNKFILITLILFVTFFYSNCQSKRHNKGNTTYKETSDSLFEYHYKILDSLKYRNPFDTSELCRNAIKFMEKYSGIKATEDANYVGIMLFNEEDLAAWKEWHRRRKEKKK